MRQSWILAAALGAGVLTAPRAIWAQTEAEWTVMVYLLGDDAQIDRDNQTISDFNELESVGSSRNLNLVVQWDRRSTQDDLDLLYPTDSTQSWFSTRRYLVVRDPNQQGVDPNALLPTDPGFRIASSPLLDLGELDMGDPQTLIDFASWCFERFPARHYLLVINGGGYGWKPRSRAGVRGMVNDLSPDPSSMLTNAEVRTAMTRIKTLNGGTNLDAVALDVGRWANLETAYQFRGTADFVLARWLDKEDDGFPYDTWMAQLASALPTEQGGIRTLLDNFAGRYLASYGAGTILLGGPQSTTVGVYQMNQIEALKTAVDNLAQALLQDLPSYASTLLRVLAQVQRGRDAGFDRDNIDLRHFATLVQAEFTDVTITTAAGLVVAAIDNVRVNSSSRSTLPGGFNVDNFNGIGIYFPAVVDNFDTAYATVTDFTAGTQWDELVQGLLTLYSDQNGPVITIGSPLVGATIIDNPPEIVATILDRDPGGRVNEASIVLTLDGRTIPRSDYTYDATTGLLRYVIPNPLTVTGHSFTISARDLSGNQSVASGNFRIAVPNLAVGIQTFSLPRSMTAAEADPVAIFGRDNFALARWVPSLFGSTKYRNYPDTFATFLPPDASSALVQPVVSRPPAGLGYWLRIQQSRPLPSLPGTPITSGEYIIQLYNDPGGGPGWNMIANPFDVSAVGLASASVLLPDGRRITFRQAIQERLTPGVVFTYTPNSSNPNAPGRYDFQEAGEGQLVRLQGHWLRANEDFTLVISSGARMAQPAPTVRRRPSSGWSLTIRAAQDELQSDTLELGVSNETRAEYDPIWDVAAPPALPGGISLRTTHVDWGIDSGRYLRDYQGVGQTASWDIEVAAPAGAVTLTWPSLREVPAGVELSLTDLSNGAQRRMRTTAAYRFEHTGGVRALRVTALPRVQTALALTDVTLTNSRGGGYEIGFAVTREATVQALVSSLSGRTVREVVGTSTAGRGRLYWDGRDAVGRPVPNGIYRLQLLATAADGTVARYVQVVRVVR